MIDPQRASSCQEDVWFEGRCFVAVKGYSKKTILKLEKNTKTRPPVVEGKLGTFFGQLTNVDPALINPSLLIGGIPGFSGESSLLEGNTPILINRVD